MRRLLLLLVAASLAGAVRAQAPEPPALSLVRAAYDVVLDGQVRTVPFAVSMRAGDTATVEGGTVTTVLDPETARPTFRVDFDAGELSAAALADDAYQVAMPRTRTVYVDSSRTEMGSGAVGMLLFHPALGPALFAFVSDATRSEIVGPEVVDGRPCVRAGYDVPIAAGGSVSVSVCYDDATALPSEIVLAEAGGVETRMTFGVPTVLGPPTPATFALDLPEGWHREPYDSSVLPVLETGTPAPAFVLPDAARQPVALASFRGRYVLVDFWGTWCAPCVEAIPHLAEIARRYPDLVVLGVAAYEDDTADPAAFVRARGGDYPVLRADDATLDAWKINAFPAYFVVGPTGTVAFTAISDRDADPTGSLDAFLARAFAR